MQMKYLALEKTKRIKDIETEDIQNYKRTTLGIVNEKKENIETKRVKRKEKIERREEMERKI